MKDRYGNEFSLKDLKNKEDFPGSSGNQSKLDNPYNLIVINNYLYLFSDLKKRLKENHYCRLVCPYTRKDLLPNIPEFQCAIRFESKAAEYNAYILDENPNFVNLLVRCAKVILKKDLYRATISFDEEFASICDEISSLPPEQKKAFNSLFLNNRSYFSYKSYLQYPVKWDVRNADINELGAYVYSKLTNTYTDYPYRNVLLSDFFNSPQATWMPSLGMDILYLVQEYYRAKKKRFSVFTNEDPIYLVTLEIVLKHRIGKSTNVLIPADGKQAFTLVSQMCEYENECDLFTLSKILQLKKACENYLQHLPLKNKQDVSIIKRLAVQELYDVLVTPNPSMEEIINKFKELFSQKQEDIAKHRDSAGIRFLNIVASILSVGFKNLATYAFSSDGYWGFWNSRGTLFNHHVQEILNKQPAL